MKKILVIGSLNMDFSIKTDLIPKIGETVIGSSFTLVPGGKGANQAYALGKLGANVSMLGMVGDDPYATALINNLNSVSVDTEKISKLKDTNTGVAFVTVDKTGDNSIIVISGANHKITKEYIDQNIELINNSDIIIMQLEIPLEVVSYVAKLAHNLGKTVILDPAPAINNLSEEKIAVNGISIYATLSEELEMKKVNVKNYMDAMELRAVPLRFEQERVFKSMLPIFEANEIEERIGTPMPSSTMAET